MKESIIKMLLLHPEGFEFANIVACSKTTREEVQACLDEMVNEELVECIERSGLILYRIK